MEARRRSTIPLHPSWSGYCVALGVIALASGLIVLLPTSWRGVNVELLYLIATLAVALAFGRGPATLAAVTAMLIADVMFTGPSWTLTVVDPLHYPREWIALHLLLLAGLVTGWLAGGYRQRARAALRASEERYRTLVLATLEAICVVEPTTRRVLETNPAFLRLLGYTGGETEELTIDQIIGHPSPDLGATVRRILTDGAITVEMSRRADEWRLHCGQARSGCAPS